VSRRLATRLSKTWLLPKDPPERHASSHASAPCFAETILEWPQTKRPLLYRETWRTDRHCATREQIILRRARCHVMAGDVGKAVDELAGLPKDTRRAVEGWVAEARKRLVVTQALHFVSAHADSVLASLL
jgi:hypothetical protein